jgi:hypothetical protein
LLHLSTSSLLTETGRVFGVSSLIDGAVYGDNASWRWAVLAGLISGPAVVAATGLAAALPDPGTGAWAVLPLGRLALAGALVGFGSKVCICCGTGSCLALRPFIFGSMAGVSHGLRTHRCHLRDVFARHVSHELRHCAMVYANRAECNNALTT